LGGAGIVATAAVFPCQAMQMKEWRLDIYKKTKVGWKGHRITEDLMAGKVRLTPSK
jgi:hypothetical protein